MSERREPHDKLQHLEKVLEIIEEERRNAKEEGLRFQAITEEELRRILGQADTPFISWISWMAQAPAGGQMPISVGVFNPDPTSATFLAVHVFFGPANMITDPVAALATADPRLPQVESPDSGPLTVPPAAGTAAFASLHLPADALPGQYLINFFLFHLAPFAQGTLLSRAAAWTSIT